MCVCVCVCVYVCVGVGVCVRSLWLMSRSGQSTTSSDSPHHVGAVGRISDDSLTAALGQYVEACKAPSQAFHFGKYNFLRKTQAVRGEALLACKLLVYVLSDTLVKLRFKPKQMQRSLLAVNEQYHRKCNDSSRDDVDWARAVTIIIGNLCSHARRLRNPTLYQQCRSRIGNASGRTQLDELRDAVASVAPLRHAASDAPVPIAGVGQKRPASPRVQAPARMLRSREAAAPRAAAGTQSADPANRASAPGAQIVLHYDAEGWPIDPGAVTGAAAGASSSESSSSEAGSDDDDASTSDASAFAGVARGPAPTKLTKEQQQVARRGLAQSVRKPLSGTVQFKTDCQPVLEKSYTEIATVTMGQIGLWLGTNESNIRLLEGHSWKYIVTVHSSHSERHQSIMRRIFRRAIEMDYDADDMRAECSHRL